MSVHGVVWSFTSCNFLYISENYVVFVPTEKQNEINRQSTLAKKSEVSLELSSLSFLGVSFYSIVLF